MERLSMQEWTAMSPEEQKLREAEMPWEVFSEQSKREQDRLVSLNIEKDRKLTSALAQIRELDEKIKVLQTSGAPSSQIQSLQQVRERYMVDYEKDPMMANAKLVSEGVNFALEQRARLDVVKKQALRKLRKEFARDYEKYGDELEDKLDLVTGPLTVDDVVVMFNALRGSSIDDQIKEAEKRGAQKALEEAGVVAADTGGSSGGGESTKSSLTQEQKDEMNTMMLSEKDYKELLRDRQEDDKRQGKTPRTLINPKH